jgi:hypothetical protein
MGKKNAPQKIVFNGIEYPSQRAFIRFLAGEDIKKQRRLFSLFRAGYTVDAIAAAKDFPSGFLRRVQTRAVNTGRQARREFLAKKGHVDG